MRGCLIISLLFVSLGCFWRCTNDMREVMALPRYKLQASQIGDSVTMIYTDSAQLKLMVKANQIGRAHV